MFARAPHGEASVSVALLTSEFGLVRARAQGVRKPGAKLAPALQTLAECDAILVRGKDGWRLSGALLVCNWASTLDHNARKRAGRLATLIARLMHGESADSAPFQVFRAFIAALPTLTEEEQDAAECLAALRILSSLGLDAGELPGGEGMYDDAGLAAVSADRTAYVARVNRGIAASGL